MNNVTHNLHLNGQTTVAWKTLLYVLVGICFFGCLSIALCSFHTIYLYVGFKSFWFSETKAQVKWGTFVWILVCKSCVCYFLVSSHPLPPHPRGRSCPANELGHDSQPLYSLGDVSRKIFVSVFAPRVIPGTALSPSILARAFCKHYFV